MHLLLAALLLLQIPDPIAEVRNARTLADSGELTAAAAMLERAVDAYPTWGLAHVELAEVLLRAGQLDSPRLEASLQKARELDAGPRAWSLSGRWFEATGRAEAAVEAYRRALSARPDRVEDREQLARLLVQAGAWAEAIGELEALLDARPGDSLARAGLAEAYEQTGRLEDAERQLRALVDAAPGGSIHRRRLIRFYERIGRPEAAAAEAARLEEPRPTRKLRPLPPSKR